MNLLENQKKKKELFSETWWYIVQNTSKERGEWGCYFVAFLVSWPSVFLVFFLSVFTSLYAQPTHHLQEWETWEPESLVGNDPQLTKNL